MVGRHVEVAVSPDAGTHTGIVCHRKWGTPHPGFPCPGFPGFLGSFPGPPSLPFRRVRSVRFPFGLGSVCVPDFNLA